MDEISGALIAFIIGLAFLCEFVDSTLGMGYGTTLTPILLLFGFGPIQIVPAVLLSELVSGILAGVFHHFHGNVNFKPTSGDIFKIRNMLSPLGYVQAVRKSLPRHLKVAILLSICGIAGTIAAVFVALHIPKFWLKMYIGCLVLVMGLLIIICYKKQFKFSWQKITLLGLVASFNKGMSGGGYGPLVTGGQILSGMDSKSAVGITSLAEGLTCLVGVVCYWLLCKNTCDWKLAPWITIGAVFSVPFTAVAVKKINEGILKMAIAGLTITLGAITIIQTLMKA